MLKILNIVGARPQFIKVSPILRAINKQNESNPETQIDEILVHTGQHYDKEMSKVFFDQLEIKEPEYNLGVGSESHGHQTGDMLKRIEEVLEDEKPDIVVVYGDTNSTLAGTLAAAKLNITVVHVEAGLRSYNRQMPEETNRVLTDHASDILFCPTETAVENLRKEGFTNIVNTGNLIADDIDTSSEIMSNLPVVINVGDVMYDASLQNVELAREKSDILEEHDLLTHEYALATVHRAENTDNPNKLSSIFEALRQIAKNKMSVILPIHPRTEKRIEKFDIFTGEIDIISPVDYLDMIMLEDNASVILTDSGGIQKEAYFYKTPCITLREETEWVETVEMGWNKLVGADQQSIVNSLILKDQLSIEASNVQSFGKGNSAENMVEILNSVGKIR